MPFPESNYTEEDSSDDVQQGPDSIEKKNGLEKPLDIWHQIPYIQDCCLSQNQNVTSSRLSAQNSVQTFSY